MKSSDEFREFIAHLQAGDADAVAEAYRRFGPLLRVAVRRKLNPDIRTRFDSLDFVQDVWATFLQNPIDGEKLPTTNALIAYLCKIARNKVTDEVRRRFTSQKASIHSEACSDDGLQSNVLAPPPTPSQWAIASDEFEAILSQFPAGHRAIVHRLREGYTNDDIARMSNLSLSTVNRVVRRLKELTGR